MPDFSQRSEKKELLDQDNIPFADILVNMNELNTVNHLLGGHQVTCDGVKQIIRSLKQPTKKNWLICEIGCGNGNNLTVIHQWCRSHGIDANFIGIDINQHCIDAADPSATEGRTNFITSDYANVTFDQKPDIIFSSLFCHHFTDLQLITQIGWLKKNSAVGFFINDLHRHPLAWHSISIITRMVSKSYLVKNDAPLSVLRGFKRSEWERLLSASGIDNYFIKWRWAFRWLIVIVN